MQLVIMLLEHFVPTNRCIDDPGAIIFLLIEVVVVTIKVR